MDCASWPARPESRILVRIVKILAAVTAFAVLAGCASPGVPPGGPVDTEAPQIVRIIPDSAKTGTTPSHVIFRFDEVVSERPTGVPSLSALFLISPRDGEPRVDWHRDELSVRPHKDWRKNTAYTITMLPGLSDLRGNTRNTGAVTVFSTGPEIPKSHIGGTLFNWTEGRPITRGIVEARLRSDTMVAYVTSPDSLGNFAIPYVPPGQYILRGFSDDNSNRGLDRRESFDTAGVNLTDSSHVDLYAFIHDSIGSRLQSANMRDSVALDISFDNPISMTPPVTPAQIRVRGSDSTDVGVLSVATPPRDTSAAAKRVKRPAPPRTLTIKLAHPLSPRLVYRVRVVDVRNLIGVLRTSDVLISGTAAKPPAPAAPPPIAPPAAPVKK